MSRPFSAVLLAGAASAVLAAAARAEDAATGPSLVEEVVVTAPSKSFGATGVQVGAFRNATVLDTPLTVNVIPREVLDAQGAEGLYDALRNTGGVTRSQLNGTAYDNVAIRGILVENRGNYRLNGSLPVINLVEQPLEDKTRVEVLKGASGLYYGFVPPSGVINLTTKRAGSQPVTEFSVRGDDHGTLIAHADLGRRFFDGSVGARLNVAGGRLETGVDGVTGQRFVAATAVDWDVTDRLSFKLDLEHIEKDVAEPAAIALPPAVSGKITLPRLPDPKQNLAGAWQHYDASATNVLARADWRISDAWAAKVELGRAETVRNRDFSQFQFANGTTALTTGAGSLRIFQVRDQAYANDNVRAELTGALATGPVEHEVTFGWTRNERSTNGRQNKTSTVAQNYFSPLPIAEIPVTGPTATKPSTITDQGAYLFDRLKWGDRWQAIVGVRRSDYENVSATSRYEAQATSPMVALIYKPVPTVSLYATWLRGLEESGTAPASAANAFDILPPAESEQYEAGVKAILFGRFTATLAGFQIERASTYTNSSNVFVLDGRARYRGVEFAGSGEVSKTVSVVASALWLNAEQVSGAASVVGKRPENTPELTASAFVEWRPEAVPGLSLNAGAFYVGDRAVNPTNQAFVAGYTSFTAGARYRTEVGGKRTTFQMNVENLTDEVYWNAAGNGLLGVSAPRTFKFEVTTAL
jgi:iron complex outermembrane receptor protein